ncbi:MAG: MBL fold metallo-hydrolase [Chitinispirillaceae bacterium]|nr:MBL fold metallo-hydrolase [Chitinispirillaceae bacterium]
MRISFWGSRGQIPVCGKEFNKYGGDTTCVEITSNENDIIIVDAGSGIRNINIQSLYKKDISIILTHFHLDHIIGFPFFSPLYNSSYSITVYAPTYNSNSILETLSTIIGTPFFPLELRDLSSNIKFIEIENSPFKIGSIRITPIKLNHPNGGFGFRFEENGKVFVFLTDNELRDKNNNEALPFSYYVEFCKDADLLIHDAEFSIDDYDNYNGWGHSSYLDAVELAIESSVKQLGLFHFHNNYTDMQIDKMVEDSQKIISERGKKINCFGVGNKFTLNKL